MKAYVQFMSKGRESLGSDGVFILDGRQKLETWKKDARKRKHQLRFVAPYIDGFKIMEGNFKKSRMLYEEDGEVQP